MVAVQMSSRRILLCSLPLLAALLAGCSASSRFTPNTATIASGNWQIASASATPLPSFSGEISGTGAVVTGIFHTIANSACVAPANSFVLTGSISGDHLTLRNESFAGGILTVTGTLAPDGRSLAHASYGVTGGPCAFAATPQANAQAYSPISGSYAGTFTDTDHNTEAITANLTQTPASDPNGDFQLSGSATLPGNPCFTSPVSISNSQVTGGSFTLTYTDSATTNSVTASGTFTPDGTTLNVTSFTTQGPCGVAEGNGVLTRQ